MMRTGLPGKPCGSAADGLAISASAARATAHANPPAADRPMPCAPSAILARRAHGAASALTPIDAKKMPRPCWARPAAIRRCRRAAVLSGGLSFDSAPLCAFAELVEPELLENKAAVNFEDAQAVFHDPKDSFGALPVAGRAIAGSPQAVN